MTFTMAGCVKTEDYGAIAGFANLVIWIISIPLSVWIWRRVSARKSVVQQNFETEYKRDDQLSYLHARLSALQTLTLSIAKNSPQSDQIRAKFFADSEERRSFLESTPMSPESVDALMKPFDECLKALEAKRN
jgi:hypothetical protein